MFRLAESCNFGELREELIRDRIAVSVRNTKLSEVMQLQSDLTLEKAITKACQANEIIQQIVVRGNENPTNGNGEIDRIYRQGTSRQGRETIKQGGRIKGDTTIKKCSRYGRTPQHVFAACPAKQAECNSCKKKEHWAVVCRKKKVNEFKQEESTSKKRDSAYTAADMVFADQVNIDTTQINVTPPWRTTISVNEIPIEFKIDTGTDASVIGDDMRKEFFRNALTERGTERTESSR